MKNNSLTKINDVVSETEIFDPTRHPNTEFLYVDISSIEKGEIVTFKRLKGSEAPSRARKRIKENDVIISTVRPNLNATAIVPKELDNQVCSTGFCVLRSNGNIIPDYLFFYTRTPEFINTLVSKAKGASYPAVSADDVKQAEIPIFSIEQQRLIVSILRGAQRLKNKRDQAKRATDKLLQAVFVHMFENGVDSSAKANWVPIEECMDVIIDYRGKTPPKTSKGIPLVTAKIIGDGELLEPNEFISPDIYDRWMTRGLPKYGDVLFTTEAPLGKVAQLKIEGKVALAQRVLLLRGKQNVVTNEFLIHALNSKRVKTDIENRATGSTVKGIRQSEFRKVKIPVPPIDLQNKFSLIAQKVDSIRYEQAKSSEGINHLFDSLLSKAFKGELIA